MADQSLEVLIKTLFDEKGAKAARAELDAIVKSASKASEKPHGGGLLDHFKELKATFGEAGGGVEGFFAALTKGAGGALGLLGGIAAGAGLAAYSLKVFADKQVEVAKLNAVLANNGKFTREFSGEVQKLAGEMAHLTATGSAEWLQAFTTAFKFGSTAETIGRDAEAIKNLAGVMGGDVQQAAWLYARAMEGNTEMLHRHGIQVDTTKSLTQQLAQIQEQAAQKGGGVMEARAKTITGQFHEFEGSMKGAVVGLGNLVAASGVVQTVFTALSVPFKLLKAVLPSTVEEVDGLTNRLIPLKTEAQATAEAMHKMGGDIGGVAAGANTATDALEKEMAAIDKLQAMLDRQGDAELQKKLAEIDLAESKAEKTPANKALFDKQRAEARHDAEGRKLDRQEFVDAAKAEAADAAHARATAKKKTEDDRFKEESDAIKKQIGDSEGKKFMLKDETAEDAVKRHEQMLADAQRAQLLPDELLRVQQDITSRIAAIKGTRTLEAALMNAIGRHNRDVAPLDRDAEGTYTAKNEADTAVTAGKMRREAFGITGQKEKLDAVNAAKKAKEETQAALGNRVAQEIEALLADPNVKMSVAERTKSLGYAKNLRSAAEWHTAEAETDPNKRAEKQAELRARGMTPEIVKGLTIENEGQLMAVLKQVGSQASAAISRSGNATAAEIKNLASTYERSNAAMVKAIRDANSRALGARPPGGF